jgi:hypothetical protein
MDTALGVLAVFLFLIAAIGTASFFVKIEL